MFRLFCERYMKCFTYKPGSLRTIGVEKEINSVDSDGNMAKVAEKIWPHLKKRGYKYYTDNGYKEQINGFFIGDDQITTDAGVGTFEAIISPAKSVQESEKKLKKVLRILQEVCEKEDIRMVALGVQPRTKPAVDFWNKKQRYDVIFKKYKNKVLPSCISASDQAHIDIAPEEFVPVVNTMNALAGFMVTLFSNSPLRYGRLSASRTYREFIWDALGKNRTGIPLAPFTSVEDYLKKMWDLPCIVAKDKNGTYYDPNRKFRDFVRGEKNIEKVFQTFTIHEGTIWFCARPRVYGTIEIRPSCLQPWDDMISFGAFAMGAVQNYRELETFVKDFRWKELRELRYKAAEEGFTLKMNGKPIAFFLQEILNMVEKGLKSRKLHEEKYLVPLFERVAQQKAPVEVNLTHYKKGGLSLLLNKTTLQKKHLA